MLVPLGFNPPRCAGCHHRGGIRLLKQRLYPCQQRTVEIRHAYSTRDSVDVPQILCPRKCAPRTPVSLFIAFFIGLLIPAVAELH